MVDGALMSGLALSLFAAGNVTAVTFSSRLSDVHGRKPLILIGLTTTAIMTGLIGFASSPVLFLTACLLAGTGTGQVVPALQQATELDEPFLRVP